MPELGEVEIVRRNLARWWAGRAGEDVLVHDPKILTRGTPERLREVLASTCAAIHRRGKYLYAEFIGGEALVIHFRMTGKITCESVADPEYARLAWRIGDAWLVFKDPRRLGHVDLFERGELAAYAPIAEMGPEPHDLDGPELAERVGKRLLKNALLDQKVIAGVGNIAVSEVFFRVGIAPDARGSDLSPATWRLLVRTLVEFFDEVIEEHQADEIQYINTDGGENPFEVYQREGEPCPRCGTPIARMKVAGRSSYYCPSCQS